MKNIFYGIFFITLSTVIFSGCNKFYFYPSHLTGEVTVLGGGKNYYYTLKTEHDNRSQDLVIEINDKEMGQKTVQNKILYKGPEAELIKLFDEDGLTGRIEKIVTDIVNDRYTDLYECSMDGTSSVIKNYDVSWGSHNYSNDPSEFSGNFTCKATSGHHIYISVTLWAKAQAYYIFYP